MGVLPTVFDWGHRSPDGAKRNPRETVISSSRPSEARAGTHNHRSWWLRKAAATAKRNHKGLWLWVPAFAGTTDGESLLRRRYRTLRRLGARAITLVDIVDHQRLEVSGDGGPTQGAEFLAVDEHGRGRRFAGAGQRDADIGVLGFAGAVDDAAHHSDVEAFDAGILRLPARHFLADDVLQQDAESRGRRHDALRSHAGFSEAEMDRVI